MKPIPYKVTTFPPEDDPGWYEADVWDCDCGVCKIAMECLECPGCLAAQPPGSVYRGKCWGMKLSKNPSSLLGLPVRPLIPQPEQRLADVRALDDERFFRTLRKWHEDK